MGIQTLDIIIQALGHKLDSIADLIAEIIIKKAGEINRFIREDVDKAMKSFLLAISLEKSLVSLSKVALNHRNPNIRKMFAENLNWLREKKFKLIDTNEKLKTKFVKYSTQLSKDPNKETRFIIIILLY